MTNLYRTTINLRWLYTSYSGFIYNVYMSWENRPLRGSEYCCTWAIMMKMLPRTSIRRSIFLNCWRISGYFDTKFNPLVPIEPILQKSEDLKIGNFLTSKRSIFSWHASHECVYEGCHIWSIVILSPNQILCWKLAKHFMQGPNETIDSFIARARDQAN